MSSHIYRRDSLFSKKQSGFTIVELMIALSVLSTILLISSAVLIQISSLYTKGVNSANLQNATRNVVADIGSAYQFGGNSFATDSATYSGINVKAFCFGKTRYSFITDRELEPDGVSPGGDPQTSHILWRDTMTSTTPCVPMDITQKNPSGNNTSGDGEELMPTHTRITNFSVVPDGHIGAISFSAAYGDQDLLNLAGANTTCKGDIGQQFCAISTINTTVTSRL